MFDQLTAIQTIARKEFRDSSRSALFLLLLLSLLLLTTVSIVVASFHFQQTVQSYQDSLKLLTDLGKAGQIGTKPEYYPLKMLRGMVDYLEIIGAIIGIILGYLSVAREKGKKTLSLLLSRPIRSSTLITGKMLGNSLLIALILGVSASLTIVILWSVGGVWLSGLEIAKLLLVLVLSFLYILFFYCLSVALSLRVRSLPQSLIISFVIWLVFVLIIPQIGDTMDPDNQMPGGFFTSMHLSRDQEKEVMASFTTYETNRDNLERTSVTKRYERASFALLGIKDIYNQQSLSFIFHDTWGDVAYLMAFLSGACFLQYFFMANKNLLNNGG